jgi:nucleoside diphosphate kinase
MQAVVQDFEQRVREVEGYLKMLKALERSDAVIHSASKPSFKSIPVEDSWRTVAKATVYLLIYNNVESAIRAAFGHLYRVIESNGKVLTQLSEEIRGIWIDAEHMKINRESATPESYRRKAADMVFAVLRAEVVSLSADRLPVSGNLDAQKIREICQLHGVPHKAHRAASGGVELKVVKDQRNALAHGAKSFSECGREITVDDMARIARQAHVFVRSILRNVDRYIAQARYNMSA